MSYKRAELPVFATLDDIHFNIWNEELGLFTTKEIFRHLLSNTSNTVLYIYLAQTWHTAWNYYQDPRLYLSRLRKTSAGYKRVNTMGFGITIATILRDFLIGASAPMGLLDVCKAQSLLDDSELSRRVAVKMYRSRKKQEELEATETGTK